MTDNIEAKSARSLPHIELIGLRHQILMKISRTILYFFNKGNPMKVQPFRGFLLEGPPGTGKTEIAKQAARLVGTQVSRDIVNLKFVDSARIASPKWGDAENKLSEVFQSLSKSKTIILFDDIDCLMITRGSVTAQEWHYSIDATLLHELDSIDPTRNVVIATTNRPDLVEEAVRSRLKALKIPPPPIKELIDIGKSMVIDSGVSDTDAEKVINQLNKNLHEITEPTIRDVQNFIVEVCIEEGYWK